MADEVNLDATAAVAFVSEASPARHTLKAAVIGKTMVMTATAIGEFQRLVTAFGGPVEQVRAARLLARVRAIADNPSVRARALRPTGNLEPPDIIIFGTADAMGIITLTADRRAISAAMTQGVNFSVAFHLPVVLQGV